MHMPNRKSLVYKLIIKFWAHQNTTTYTIYISSKFIVYIADIYYIYRFPDIFMCVNIVYIADIYYIYRFPDIFMCVNIVYIADIYYIYRFPDIFMCVNIVYIADIYYIYRFPDIFMCVNIPDKEDSIEGYYETWPFGMCRKFIKVNSPTTPDPLEYIKTLPFVSVHESCMVLPNKRSIRVSNYRAAIHWFLLIVIIDILYMCNSHCA